jgi:hypothetical protein
MSAGISAFEQREEETLQSVASRYREHGYDVVVRPSADKLPQALSHFQPDLIARAAQESVVVEVKSRSSLGNQGDLAQLARTVERIPGWRFELIITNPEMESSVPLDEELLTKRQILQRLEEAAQIEKDGHSEAASLLAWSAVEAALRHKSRSSGINPKGQSALSLAKSLYSVGELTKRSFDDLTGTLHVRNELVHGFRVRRRSHNGVESLGALVRELLSGNEAVR